jgi:hypothetical protein
MVQVRSLGGLPRLRQPLPASTALARAFQRVGAGTGSSPCGLCVLWRLPALSRDLAHQAPPA